METEKLEVCTATFIDVYRGINLDYEFFVSPDENIDDIKNFIIECLNKYNQTYIDIRVYPKRYFPVKNLWNRVMIEEFIKNNYTY